MSGDSVQMVSQGDGVFRRALRALPEPLVKALVEAELDDPVLLRSYRPASLAKLGLCKGGKRVHELERFFPTEAVEASTVCDVTAVLGTSTSTMAVLGTRPGLSDGKRRTRRKRVNAEYQSPGQLFGPFVNSVVGESSSGHVVLKVALPMVVDESEIPGTVIRFSRLLKVRKLLRFPRIFTRSQVLFRSPCRCALWFT